MANLLMEIEAQIAGAKTRKRAKQNVGVIREIGDGVARIEGLSDAMLNEMIDLGHGITGLALNLDETEVGVVILGDYTSSKRATRSEPRAKLLQVPVGKGLLGRVVNTLESHWTARDQSKVTSLIRSRNSLPASSGALRSDSRCKRASWRLTR